MPKQIRDKNSNEDGPSDGEKPLKKARYVWEVKGKHHLKETHKNNPVSINNNEDIEENKNSESENNNLENINLKADDACIESKGNSPHDECCTSCCCNSCCMQKFLEDADEIMDAQLDEMSNEIPLTLVTPNPKNEEYYLRKWQARQIARGFVENTINSVLDTWSNRPSDASDMVDNYANDGQVEDDAILMAIQSHGLQSSSRLEQPSSSTVDERPRGIEEFTHDNRENFENERIKEQENGVSSTDSADGLPVEDTMDFLSAAVSVAIQKKGLSYGY